MKLSTYADWQKHLEMTENWFKEHNKLEVIKINAEINDRKKKERAETLNLFPYAVMVEDVYSVIDNASKWCWEHFGPKNGICHDYYSEYPGCPLVLATETVVTGSNGVHSWTDYNYKKVEAHDHSGVWTSRFFEKTNYDEGFVEFYFKNEADSLAFRLIAPEIDLGSHYVE